ncbi:hypothetical protein ACFWN2_23940 [Lentzea sp. NPDC058436]|uniref:hypothetical protein n=1 Tax=Lentzea sp. NPDC058436 TaxID=3346499 RepID=UPI003664B570
MTRAKRPVRARLTVAEPSEPPSRWSSAVAAVADGTTQIAVGGVLMATFGGEVTKCFVTGEVGGRWWFLALAIAGLAILLFGVWQRVTAGSRTQTGIVAALTGPRGGHARIRQLEQRADKVSKSLCEYTLKVNVDLEPDSAGERGVLDDFADKTAEGSAWVQWAAPDATAINLFPAMAENVAFVFGAKISDYPFAREVVVHEIGPGGTSASVPLLSPRTFDSEETSHYGRVRPLETGDLTRVAIAVDLHGAGDQYFDQVKATCRRDGIGLLLMITPPPALRNGSASALAGVVDLVCREWQGASLNENARTGQHAIFLGGSLSMAVALGARLAARDHGRWIAYAQDPAGNTYEAFPSV